MSRQLLLQRIALPLLVAFCIFVLFGFYSHMAKVGLLIIATLVLYIGLGSVFTSLDKLQQELDASERIFTYCGSNLRVFQQSPESEIWLRACDLKRIVEYPYNHRWLQKRYPQHYGKINPLLDAWYMHPVALRDMLGKSTQAAGKRFLDWLNRDVIGMYHFERVMNNKAPLKAVALPVRIAETSWWKRLPHYCVRHWQGKVGLIAAIFVSGGMVAGANYLIHLLESPLEVTEHYRAMALIYVSQIALSSAGLYWWGKGVVLSAQRWLMAERSLIVALLACVGGLTGLVGALSHFVQSEHQYFLTDFTTILLDADVKPGVYYNAEHGHLVLDGDMGFGTSKQIRRALQEHPHARGIELKSYGGRVAEGFALMDLIAEKRLYTLVRAECMSACVYAYSGGRVRYVAASARFGLHRSGLPWQGDGGMNFSDWVFSRRLREIGVDQGFVERGMASGLQGMYEPKPEEVLQAGLGTAEWPVR